MTTSAELGALIDARVRDVADFPERGVVFKDITPLLADHTAFARVIEALADAGRDASGAPAVDRVVGMEARGFILAAPVALALGVGFVPVRKPGKLPGSTHAVSYGLEYGTATLEIQDDALQAGDRVLLVDDVLATGGTVAAAAELVATLDAEVTAFACLLELSFLGGRGRIPGVELTVLRTL